MRRSSSLVFGNGNELMRITIACVSQFLRFGDKGFNISKMETAISERTHDNIDLFVFSENNIGGGFNNKASKTTYEELAENIPNGASCQRVVQIARKYNTAICAGIIEKHSNDLFVSHFLCNSNGFVGKQRKIFSQNPDKPAYFGSGEKLHTFHLFEHNCVILACADFMFPETSILTGLSKASLIICPTDCMHEKNMTTMEMLLSSKSIGTNALTVATFGHDCNDYIGDVVSGIVVGPEGEILRSEKRPMNQDNIITLSTDLRKPRQMWGGFEYRRDILLRHLSQNDKNKF